MWNKLTKEPHSWCGHNMISFLDEALDLNEDLDTLELECKKHQDLDVFQRKFLEYTKSQNSKIQACLGLPDNFDIGSRRSQESFSGRSLSTPRFLGFHGFF